MSKNCKACGNPYATELEKEVWQGKTSAVDAAKKLGMKTDDYWEHLRTHNESSDEVEPVRIDTNDPGTVLRYLTKQLYKRVKILLATPTNGSTSMEKDIASQVRLLKDLAMDIAQLEHKIEKSPQILIQNYMTQQQELTTFLVTNLCPHCKEKVINYLKVPSNAGQ